MFRKIVISVFAAALAAVPAFAAERQGAVTFTFSLKAPAEAKDVRLWVPYPRTDREQKIDNVHVTGNFSAEKVSVDPRTGNKALFAEWKGPMAKRTLVYRFDVQRREVVSGNVPDSAGPVPAKMKQYLDLGLPAQSAKQVRGLAAEITKGKKTVFEKARAVYNWVVENMRRDPDVKGCGLGEVDRLLAARAGKCADVSAVFTSLARAAGVPARKIYGIRMHTGKGGDITKFQHCWAEFYAPDHGWVTVDPADVLKFKLEKRPTHADLAAKKKYFFGSVDQNRVQLSIGNHVSLKPSPRAGRLPYFMYPYAEADGKPLNEDLFGFNIGYKIGFRQL